MTTPGSRVPAVRTGVVALVLALTAGLLLAATGPTYAASRTSADAAGDPVRTTIDREGEQTDEPAPRAKRVDLVSTRFDYRRDVLVVRGKALAASKAVSTTLRVRTRGTDYFFTTAGTQIFAYVISADTGGEVRCPGARAAVDKGAATYRLRVPASCFGAPATVRTGYNLTSYDQAKKTYVQTSDDALRTGAAANGGSDFGFSPKLGTALARG